jgi:membrane protein
VELFLGGLTEAARRLSVIAVPAFLWFATRLFAGIRTALNEIYDVHVRPVRRNFVLAYLAGKLRDLGMVGLTLVLFLGNTLLSTGLVLLQARAGTGAPWAGFLVTRAGQWAGHGLAFAFLVSLFFAVYHFASLRRPPWRATLVASVVAAALFEAAKWLFGLYLRNMVLYQQVSADANVGAAILFVLWMYYSALVFLLGAVIAETWELRDLQRAQQATLR